MLTTAVVSKSSVWVQGMKCSLSRRSGLDGSPKKRRASNFKIVRRDGSSSKSLITFTVVAKNPNAAIETEEYFNLNWLQRVRETTLIHKYYCFVFANKGELTNATY